jgi:subtilisin family serine protease
LVLGAGIVRADTPSRPFVEPRLARALEDPVAADVELRAQDAERRRGTRTGELQVMLEPPRGLGADALPLERLRALGAHVEARSRSFVRISGSPAVLRRVAELEGIRVLRFPLKPVPVLGSGPTLSEAVALTGAGALQTSGFTGAGVKVAVVDAGFMHLADAETIGEIPASAIAVDFTGHGIESGTAHGTAVTEEVADVAPGAQLYVIAFSDELGLENAADYLRDNGIRIANLSINFFGTSYYDDSGPINDIINHSHDVDGVLWAVAAGNWAFRHWRGPWVDVDGDRFLEFTPGNERLNVVSELDDVCWTLNWNQYPDHYAGTLTDLDLFVYSHTGAMVGMGGQVRQVPGVLPVEQVCYTRNASQEPYQIAVRRISGPTAGLDLTLVGSGAAVDTSQGVAAWSILDPSDAHGAFTVGAIDQANWTQAPPGPPLENFSSVGPTTDGRRKPDIVAPDRTQTFYYGAAVGTSFASPVVAGAAALLTQQAPGIPANQLRAALVARAHDVGDPGLDVQFGWGELALSPLVVPLDSDGDSLPDATDPCPFAADNLCTCGDVDGNGTVTALDEAAVRLHLADPQNPSVPALVHPELCNVYRAAAPFPLDCLIDDWVVMRRARAALGPGIQQVCAPALPP